MRLKVIVMHSGFDFLKQKHLEIGTRTHWQKEIGLHSVRVMQKVIEKHFPMHLAKVIEKQKRSDFVRPTENYLRLVTEKRSDFAKHSGTEIHLAKVRQKEIGLHSAIEKQRRLPMDWYWQKHLHSVIAKQTDFEILMVTVMLMQKHSDWYWQMQTRLVTVMHSDFDWLKGTDSHLDFAKRLVIGKHSDFAMLTHSHLGFAKQTRWHLGTVKQKETAMHLVTGLRSATGMQKAIERRWVIVKQTDFDLPMDFVRLMVTEIYSQTRLVTGKHSLMQMGFVKRLDLTKQTDSDLRKATGLRLVRAKLKGSAKQKHLPMDSYWQKHLHLVTDLRSGFVMHSVTVMQKAIERRLVIVKLMDFDLLKGFGCQKVTDWHSVTVMHLQKPKDFVMPKRLHWDFVRLMVIEMHLVTDLRLGLRKQTDSMTRMETERQMDFGSQRQTRSVTVKQRHSRSVIGKHSDFEMRSAIEKQTGTAMHLVTDLQTETEKPKGSEIHLDLHLRKEITNDLLKQKGSVMQKHLQTETEKPMGFGKLKGWCWHSDFGSQKEIGSHSVIARLMHWQKGWY